MRLFKLAAAMFAMGSALTFTGCTKKTSPPTPSTSEQSQVKGGHPTLQFDYQQTNEVLISKNDPNTGDHWTARIKRQKSPGATSGTSEDTLWTFEMMPDEAAQGDHLAHGTYLMHLLDTIRSLQVQEASLSGSPESFGLVPPLFALRWQISENRRGGDSASSIQARVFKDYEIQLGGPVKSEDGSFQGLYASVSGAPGKIFIVRGAMLQMLDLITSFQALRLPTVVTISGDDVDELSIHRSQGRTIGTLYAQRDGDHWSDRAHQPLKNDVEAFLDLATHLRIKRFVDEPNEARKVDGWLKSNAQTILFKDRKGSSSEMRVTREPHGTRVFATFSGRYRGPASGKTGPLAVFEVYPEILNGFRDL